MDLKVLDSGPLQEEGTFLHLEDPNGVKLFTEDKEPIGITLLGINSKKLRDLSHKQQNKRIGKLRVKRTGSVRGLTSEETEDNAIELLAAACTQFHHIVVDGEEWGTTRARELMDRFDFIRQQVDSHINDEANYLGESSRS